MTEARVSRVAVEVLDQDPDPQAHVSRFAIEVLQGPQPLFLVEQAIEADVASDVILDAATEMQFDVEQAVEADVATDVILVADPLTGFTGWGIPI